MNIANSAYGVIVNDNTALTLRGTINNAGRIQLSPAGNATDLYIDGSATLTGGGEVQLDGNGQGVVTGTGSTASLTNVDNLIDGGGQLGNGALALLNQAGGVINGNGGDLVIDTGSSGATNAGLIEATGGWRLDIHGHMDNSGTIAANNSLLVDYDSASNSGTIVANNGTLYLEGTVDNSGTVKVNGGSLIVQGSITGAGTVTIAAGTLEFTAASSTDVVFSSNSGILKLDDSQDYHGTVSGLTSADTLDLADINYATVQTPVFNGDSSGGTLTVTDGAHTAQIKLFGDYHSSSWSVSDDGHGRTYVVDPPIASSDASGFRDTIMDWTAGDRNAGPDIALLAQYAADGFQSAGMGAALSLMPPPSCTMDELHPARPAP